MRRGSWGPTPVLVVLFGLTVLFLLGCQHPVLEFSTGIAVEDVAVIDVQDGRILENMTVVIEGAYITAVEPSLRIRLGEGVKRVQGSGRFLVPGFWDMHVHAVDPFSSDALPLFVANGVTGIRDMWGDFETEREVRRQMGAGESISPRMINPGHYLDSPDPWWEGSVTAGTPEEGRFKVDSLMAEGADFIKVGSLLEPTVFQALLERATELGLQVAGHVPFDVLASEASEYGLKSMEHLMGVMEQCSTFDEDIRADRESWMAARAAGEDAPNPFFEASVFRRISDGFDADLCGSLADLLAQNQSWQVPTLAVFRPGAFGFDSTFTNDPRLAYMPSGISEEWAGIVSNYQSSSSPDALEAEHDLYLTLPKIISLLKDRGVPFLAGTDAPNPYVFFGFSLHDEMELLVEAGLTPIEALRAATLNPSVFLEATDSLGSVAPGKLADLVLLDGNPLDDIANTRMIHAVFQNGRLVDRTELDQVLSEAKARAESQSSAGK